VRLLFKLSAASTATDFPVAPFHAEVSDGSLAASESSFPKGSTVQTAAQQFAGTPAYLSPEHSPWRR